LTENKQNMGGSNSKIEKPDGEAKAPLQPLNYLKNSPPDRKALQNVSRLTVVPLFMTSNSNEELTGTILVNSCEIVARLDYKLYEKTCEEWKAHIIDARKFLKSQKEALPTKTSGSVPLQLGSGYTHYFSESKEEPILVVKGNRAYAFLLLSCKNPATVTDYLKTRVHSQKDSSACQYIARAVSEREMTAESHVNGDTLSNRLLSSTRVNDAFYKEIKSATSSTAMHLLTTERITATQSKREEPKSPGETAAKAAKAFAAVGVLSTAAYASGLFGKAKGAMSDGAEDKLERLQSEVDGVIKELLRVALVSNRISSNLAIVVDQGVAAEERKTALRALGNGTQTLSRDVKLLVAKIDEVAGKEP